MNCVKIKYFLNIFDTFNNSVPLQLFNNWFQRRWREEGFKSYNNILSKPITLPFFSEMNIFNPPKVMLNSFMTEVPII